MAKISMKKAADLFAVSRPTLLKHLREGKISGEKTVKGKNEFWEIDMAELARVYPRRDEVSPELPANLTKGDTPASPDLQAEIRVLQARLEAAEALAEERKAHLDDLRKMLSAPDRGPQDREETHSIWRIFRRNRQERR